MMQSRNSPSVVGRTIRQGLRMTSVPLNPEELAARLRRTAVDLLAIARGHADGGNVEIAAKMTEAAGELIARADALRRDTDLAEATPRKRAQR